MNRTASDLREFGVALLRGCVRTDSLVSLAAAAARCFDSIRTGHPVPPRYRFNIFSHSLLLASLTDFGCGPGDLTAPLSAPGLDDLFAMAADDKWTCSLEQSWVRKKFAPANIPDRRYHTQNWHQDGALGVQFPPEAGPVVPMTRLLTCWIPLSACGTDSPGLEFVRRPQEALLHFTELDDAALRRRFAAEEFWVPSLAPGDALVFLNGTLHRTCARPEMRQDRMSVEYRLFPRE